MVATKTYISTIEELMELRTDEPWEVWKGELREVPGAGGKASGLATWIGVLLTTFVMPRGLGWITGADGTFVLSHVPLVTVVPDVAFIRWERLPDGAVPDGYITVPPDFVVEVRSPSDRDREIAEKLELYREAGVPLIWWVDPKQRTVTVYRDGERVAELGEADEVDGEQILPGFRLPVAELFAVMSRQESERER